MGTRALEFGRAHPDADAGYAMAAAKLEQLVARAGEAAAAQRSGIVDVRAASARKAELRRTMLAVHIAHLAQVGREAAREDHELGKTFRFKPQAGTYLAFRTAARNMAVEAETHRELLIRHGLAASVLEEFVQRVDEFDAVVALGHTGRAVHMGATAELNVGGGRDRAGGAGDGRAEPAAVPGRPAAAGGVGGRQHGAGGAGRGGGVAPVSPGKVAPGGAGSPAGDVRPAA